jgi:hypothetical protein
MNTKKLNWEEWQTVMSPLTIPFFQNSNAIFPTTRKLTTGFLKMEAMGRKAPMEHGI